MLAMDVAHDQHSSCPIVFLSCFCREKHFHISKPERRRPGYL